MHIFYKFLSYNTILELLWNIVPILFLALIAVPSFSLLYFIDDTSLVEHYIKIMGNQWYWSYEFIASLDITPIHNEEVCNGIYEYDSFESRLVLEEDLGENGFGFRLLDVDQRLSLLTGIYTSLLISATDVLHSWAVPSLGIKCDACPGRLNQVICNINRVGVYYGQCSEICGLFHAYMPIVVTARSNLSSI